jgi:hypothetical protein
MDLLGKARALESTLTRTIERAAQKVTKTAPAEPLELLHAIVDVVGERVEPAGRDTRVFPFNRLAISIVAASDRDRARFEAVFESGASIHDRIVERLRAEGCDAAGLSIRTMFVDQPGSDWQHPGFDVEFDRGLTPVRAVPRVPYVRDELTVTIVHGSADTPTCTFALARINLGRCAQVRDRRNQLVRINHIAFDDIRSEPNQSVSRRHAHIEYVDELRAYRLYDDRSGYGTCVVRNGRTVPVPGGTRGIRLESGDEIVLGEARLRVDY